MQHIRRLATQTFTYGLGTFVPRLLNFAILTPLYTRELSRYEYGIFTELYTYAMVFMVLLTWGMETTYFKFSADRPNEEKQIFSNILFFIVGFSVLFLFAISTNSQAIKNGIQFPGDSVYIKIFGLILSFDAISAIGSARLRAKEQIIRFSIIKFINVLSTITLVLLFFKLCNTDQNIHTCTFLGDNETLYYIFLINAITSGLQLVLLLPELLSINFKIDFKQFLPHFVYALPLMVSGLSGIMNEALDRILLRHLIPDKNYAVELLGIYGANCKFAVVMSIFIQMFRYAAEPYFFSIFHEKDSKNTYSVVMTYFVIFCSVVFLAVLLFLDITKLYLGEDFHEGLGVVPFVLFANILLGILVNVNFWYKLSKKTMYAIIIFAIGILVTIVGNIILVPHISYFGSAISRILSYGSMIIISFYLGRKFYKINYDIKKIGFYIGITLGIYFISLLYSDIALGIKLFLNSILIFAYLILINRKEKFVTILFRHENKNR